MPYYLQFDGIDDYVETVVSSPSGASSVDIEVDFWADSAETEWVDIANAQGAGQISLNRYGLGIVNVFYNLNGSWVGVTASSPIAFDERNVVKTTYNGATGNIELIINGVVVGTASGSGGNLTRLEPYIFGGAQGGLQETGITRLFLGRIYSATINISGTAYTYDPSASEGAGLVLPDTTSSQDGTLVNFPTDDSQWGFYSDGPATPINLSANNILPTSARLGWE